MTEARPTTTHIAPDTVRRDNGRAAVMMLAPALHAVSGVSAHVGMLLESSLREEFDLYHFQIGSEGRNESTLSRLLRLMLDPVRLLRAIRRYDVAAIHVNSSLNRGAFWRDLLFLVVARLNRTPALLQIHGGALPQEFFRGRRLFTALLRSCLSLPARIVVLGEEEVEAYRRFVPRQNVSIVPNAIDCKPFVALEGRREQRPGKLRLVFLGRLANGKGLCELLHAMASPRLSEDRPRLVIAGGGPEENYLHRLADELGLHNDVDFAGPVFGRAKRELLSQADVFVLPSYSEGLPYALIEAMAAGAAVITTPVGAIPDVIDHNVHGLLIPARDIDAIADAVHTLQSDRQALKRMARAGRERAFEHYDIARLEQDFADVYHAVVDGKAALSCSRIVQSHQG